MIKVLMFVALLLISYVSAGAQFVDSVWMNIVEGPGGQSAGGLSIAVDTFGNVYAAGFTSNGMRDCLVIKYNHSGDSLWARTYNGPGNGHDWINDIKVDEAGFVYVTGISTGSGTGYDFITIKYNSSGTQLWAERYDASYLGSDEAYSLAVDYVGNVIVAGRFWDGFGNDFDLGVIKYTPSGDTAWVRRYLGISDTADAALAVDVDDSGNVYVAGAVADNSVYPVFHVRKYYANGLFAWATDVEGDFGGSDTALAIVVNESGSAVYATGKIYLTNSDYNYTTVKYSTATGDTIWTRAYDGGNSQYDGAVDIALDNLENVIVTGTSTGPGTVADLATIKYNSMGTELWVKRYYGDSTNTVQGGNAVAVDNINNIYVTGYAQISGNNFDFVTMEYRPNGDTEWSRTLGGPDNWMDVSHDIAVDDYGNAYITGDFFKVTYETKMATVRYSHLGPMEITAYSPVNLWITDPAGDYIGKDADGNLFQTLFPATYIEPGPGGTDIVSIDYPIEGEYTIEVIAETGAASRATYSVGIRIDGSDETMLVVDQDVPSEKLASDFYSYVVDEGWHYKNGDPNRDGIINIFDVTMLISFLYLNGPAPYPEAAGDANCDLTINIFDVTHLISYLYMGGPAPCEMTAH